MLGWYNIVFFEALRAVKAINTVVQMTELMKGGVLLRGGVPNCKAGSA